MVIYKKESLELLRKRIDLAEVLSGYIALKRSGSAFKACCPFHEEKTPSFTIQRGDSHYHCYGCGAHGDSIAFLMSYLKLSFVEAVEMLAERFQVFLEEEHREEASKGPNKTILRQALERACKLYHFSLLYSEEGKEALEYLQKREIDLSFIRLFRIGFAPALPHFLLKVLKNEGFEDKILEEAGLVSSGFRKRDFFSGRITFPILDKGGSVIGFSARKIREETYGGKYINTQETSLFKKSQVLFGLSYCRQRIAKERKAVVVEGQIDALRAIKHGLNLTVAALGTAFGEDHVRELLSLGVNHIYLALDADRAGLEASVKIGHIFQKKGVEVSIASLPQETDPDSFIRKEGMESFLKKLEASEPYLNFLYKHLSKGVDLNSPSKKNELIENIKVRMGEWEHPLMVHESTKRLALLASVPEHLVRIDIPKQPKEIIKKVASVEMNEIDSDRVLETDLLRWLILLGETKEEIIKIASLNLSFSHFYKQECRNFYFLYLDAYKNKKPRDLLSLGMLLNQEEQHVLSDLMQKRVNLQRGEENFIETVRKLLTRKWMQDREEIKIKLESSSCSEAEISCLLKQFDEIKNEVPRIVHP